MNNGKSQIEHTLDAYRVTLPSRKYWFTMTFGLIWIVGWFGALFFVIWGDAFEGSEDFLTFWLASWIVGGLFVGFLLLWLFIGKETIEIKGSEVLFEKTILDIGLKNKLERSQVKNFRFEQINMNTYGGNRMAIWGLGPGKIKFDYGMKTYSFGLGVDDAEARFLVEELNRKIA